MSPGFYRLLLVVRFVLFWGTLLTLWLGVIVTTHLAWVLAGLHGGPPWPIAMAVHTAAGAVLWRAGLWAWKRLPAPDKPPAVAAEEALYFRK